MTTQTTVGRQQRGIWKWVIGLAAVALVLVALLLPRQINANSEAAVSAEANSQTTATVFEGDIDKTISSNGNLFPATEANLRFSTTGEVATIEVAEGDTVAAGDILMVLDTAALERSVEDAQLLVDIRQADLDALSLDDVLAAEERVADAEDALDLADEEGDETAIADAEAELSAAQAELDALDNAQLDYQRTIAESQLAQAENSLEAAEANLDAATLTAPFDGIVSQILVSEGDLANGIVASMFDPESLIVTLEIDEIDLLELDLGTDASLTVDALPGVSLDGTVSHVAVMPSNSMSDRVTYLVEVEIAENDETLRYGMSTRVRLTTAERDDVLLVPNEAITANTTDGTYFVTVVEDGANLRAEVEIGIRDRQFTEIESGLTSGDEVVVRTNVVPESEVEGPPTPFGN